MNELNVINKRAGHKIAMRLHFVSGATKNILLSSLWLSFNCSFVRSFAVRMDGLFT